MTIGTVQYEDFGALQTFTGDGDFIMSASTPKHQQWDCGGSGRTVDLIYVDASEKATSDDTTGGGIIGATLTDEIGDGVFAGDGVTTSRGEIHIDNIGGEDFTVRDGNNGDAALGVIDLAPASAILYWVGSKWIMVGGKKVT